jgi:hypothetical protein
MDNINRKNRSTHFLLLLIPILFLVANVHAQADSVGKHHISIFLPLYLDSAFDPSSNYRYDKSFPKFINPGLEFYEGVQMAIDSLRLTNNSLDIRVYDTKSTTQTIDQILHSADFQQTELIIGHVNMAELRSLADVASHKNIPFINVNLPNDGGVTNNPDLVILNSTLKTHCEGIYKYLQRNYPTRHIVFFGRKGPLEERMKGYFANIDKTTASVPIGIKYVVIPQPVAQSDLTKYLDSTQHNYVVVSSLDETFGKDFCLQLAQLSKTYPLTVIGMPTWDNIAEFSQPEYNGLEICFSTPFYSNPNDSLVSFINQTYKSKFYSRPSDMVFRGYETTLRFGRLLSQYGQNLSGSIGEKKYKVFSDFDIEPVFLNKDNMTLDYFENKKLYFVKKLNGTVTAVN